MSPSLSPSPNDKKSNGPEDPLLTYSTPDYISEYLGYKGPEPPHARHPRPKSCQVCHACRHADRGDKLPSKRKGVAPRTCDMSGQGYRTGPPRTSTLDVTVSPSGSDGCTGHPGCGMVRKAWGKTLRSPAWPGRLPSAKRQQRGFRHRSTARAAIRRTGPTCARLSRSLRIGSRRSHPARPSEEADLWRR
jgi:hypothetical protein